MPAPYMSAVQFNSTPVITCDHSLIPAIVSYRIVFLNLYSAAHGKDRALSSAPSAKTPRVEIGFEKGDLERNAERDPESKVKLYYKRSVHNNIRPMHVIITEVFLPMRIIVYK